jgi:hypothetical protein
MKERSERELKEGYIILAKEDAETAEANLEASSARNQTWFWSQEWQEQIAQSMKDIEKRKVKVFKSVKEAKKKFGD